MEIHIIYKNKELLNECFTTKKGCMDYLNIKYNNSSRVKSAFIIGSDHYELTTLTLNKKNSGRFI